MLQIKVSFLTLCIVIISIMVLALVGPATALTNQQATSPVTAAASTLSLSTIEPGDTLNGITLNRVISPDDNVPTIAYFCTTPSAAGSVITSVCDVPLLSKVYLIGSYSPSGSETLDELSAAVRYELYFDGHPIDLAAFGTIDLPPDDQNPKPSRNYFIGLSNLAAGKHTYLSAIHVLTDVGILRASHYELTIFTLNIGVQNFAIPCGLPATSIAVTPAMTATQTAVSTQEAGAQPYLGIAYQPSSCGVAIVQVVPNSPADAADLRAGDIILAVNGVSVWNLPGYRPMPVQARPGLKVLYKVLRDTETITVVATLGTKP